MESIINPAELISEHPEISTTEPTEHATQPPTQATVHTEVDETNPDEIDEKWQNDNLLYSQGLVGKFPHTLMQSGENQSLVAKEADMLKLFNRISSNGTLSQKQIQQKYSSISCMKNKIYTYPNKKEFMSENEFKELMRTDFEELVKDKYDYRKNTKPPEALTANNLIDRVYLQNFDSDEMMDREVQVGNPKTSYQKVADLLVEFGLFDSLEDINQDILDAVLDPNFDGEFDQLDFNRFIHDAGYVKYEEDEHIRLK